MALDDGEIDLSIIIVNWNSLEFLRGCLRSLPPQDASLCYEVIVVDNRSTDGSRVALKSAEFREVRVLLPERNLGFVRANNLAAREARGRNLLFLNPDTVVIGDALSLMVRPLDSDPGLAITGCTLLNRDLSIQTTCVQRIPTLTNQLLGLEVLRRWFPKLPLWGLGPLYEPSQSDPKTVDFVSGACLMIRRAVFDAAGGFSKDYFMYAEEVDLCFTAAKAGWKVGYVGAATVIHYGGQSSHQVRKSSFSNVLMANSVFTFLRKTKGLTYASFYRAGQACSGICRILALAIFYGLVVCVCPKRAGSLRGALVKWAGITRWALGLETWTDQLLADSDS